MAFSSSKVRDFLNTSGRPLVTIGSNETVEKAIRTLVEHNIGALSVCDGDTLLGIVSERDLMKECLRAARDIGSTRVRDVMTRNVIIGLPDDDLEYVMRIMTEKGIRHLPVMDGPKLAGMVSIRDVVHVLLEASRAEARFLSDYISGGYR